MVREKNLYMYVYRMLLTDIYKGRYQYLDKLPTLPELCLKYDMGRNTIRNALKELENDGYISQQQGTKAVVTFNILDFDSNQSYRQVLKDSMEMTKDVYQILEILLPEIEITCFQELKKSDIEELHKLVECFTTEYIHNETELIDKMYVIYLFIIRILHNPVLLDLAETLLVHAYQPLAQENQTNDNIHRSTKGIRRGVSLVLWFAQQHRFSFAKQMIASMCKLHGKMSMKRLEAMCKDISIKEPSCFVWVCNRNQEYLYAEVVLKIMEDIVKGKYLERGMLPSISILALQYDVSEKTIRSSLQILREYKMIETINGIGSKVVLESIAYDKDVLRNERLLDNLRMYRYTLQTFTIVMQAVLPFALKTMTKEEVRGMADRILQDNDLKHFYETIFERVNPCLLVIYKELIKNRNWKLLCLQLSPAYCEAYEKAKHCMMVELKQGDYKKIIAANLHLLKIDEQHLLNLIQIDKK